MSYNISSQEKRHLKRPKLGPPDVYPQESKQKEDELTAERLKTGYANNNPCYSLNEYVSARPLVDLEKFTAAKVAQSINAINARKKEIRFSNLPDASRRRTFSRDNSFWPASLKPALSDKWLRGLAGNEPLSELGKKIPIFIKRDGACEVFTKLADNNVTMARAVWYIKMVATYPNMGDAARNRRKPQDPCAEWTDLLTTFLRDYLLRKLGEHYSFTNDVAMNPDYELTLKRWQYCVHLAKYMDEEELLDRQCFLQWLLDLFVKHCRSSDEGLFVLLIPLMLEFLCSFTQSEILSRKLAFAAAQKLSEIYDTVGDCESHCHSPSTTHITSNSATGGNNGQYSWYSEFMSCSFHRPLVLCLSSIIQAVLVDCPTALVWNNLSSTKKPGTTVSVDEPPSLNPICGSALDLLPCSPSCLPVPNSRSEDWFRDVLKTSEEELKDRSLSSELQWSTDDTTSQSGRATVVSQLLDALETIDNHVAGVTNSSNCVDSLYQKMFPPGSTEYELKEEEIWCIKMLCSWSVSPQRYGLHRPLLVARILEKRQRDWNIARLRQNGIMVPTSSTTENSANADGDDGDNNDAVDGMNNHYPLQLILWDFLNCEAPAMDEVAQSKPEFLHLIMLFGELVRLNVFSHDMYVQTLISRGDLSATDGTGSQRFNRLAPTPGFGISSEPDVSSALSSRFSSADSSQEGPNAKKARLDMLDFSESKEPDEPTVDFEGIIAAIGGGEEDGANKEFEVSGEKPATSRASPSKLDRLHSSVQLKKPSGSSRHYYNLLHFPLPQTDSYRHEANQRETLLYGYGSDKSAHKHLIKRVIKDINKMFSRRYCIEAQECGSSSSSQKAKRSRCDLANAGVKFRTLSYHDRTVVVEACAEFCLDQFEAFIEGNISYIPTVDNVDYLISLFEDALDYSGIVNFAEGVFEYLVVLEGKLVSSYPDMTKTYSFSLGLLLVGVLQRYHPYVILNDSEVETIFKGLLAMMKEYCSVENVINSTRKCLWLYLHELYTACDFLQTKSGISDEDGIMLRSESVALWSKSPAKPSALCANYDKQYMRDYISNPGLPVSEDIIRELNENDDSRYSFVINAVLDVLDKSVDAEKLKELAILCADLSVRVNGLSSDYLGALKALTPPEPPLSDAEMGFMDLMKNIEPSYLGDAEICRRVSFFCSILFARNTMPLEVFLRYPMRALLNMYRKITSEDGSSCNEMEMGILRLSLHFFTALLCVPKRPDTATTTGSTIKFASDQYLLAACHRNLQMYPIVQILKSILMLVDSLSDTNLEEVKNEPSIGEIIGTVGSSGSDKLGSITDVPSHQLAFDVLRELCGQHWIREKFGLVSLSDLFGKKFLLCNVVSSAQAVRLLNFLTADRSDPCLASGASDASTAAHPLVAQPSTAGSATSGGSESPVASNASAAAVGVSSSSSSTSLVSKGLKEPILRILKNLGLWNLRTSLLQLQLLIKQTEKQTEKSQDKSDSNKVVEIVAKACLEIFQNRSEKHSKQLHSGPPLSWERIGGVWLIAPLVSQLPSSVQARVLKEAAHVLEAPGKRERNGEVQKSIWLLSEQPFLCLVLTCLRGQEEQRDALLNSLLKQLQDYVQMAKQDLCQLYTREMGRELREALQLRLSLAGGMFDTVCKNSNVEQWAILLTQLIVCGVVQATKDDQLYHTCLDMLTTIVHHLLLRTEESGDQQQEYSKLYTGLCKKIKKEIGDSKSEELAEIEQLLPIPRCVLDVQTFVEYGSTRQSRNSGNKPAASSSPSRDFTERSGFSPGDRVKVNPWDIIEGRPGGISWAWFHAIKVDSGPERMEVRLARLAAHSHCRSSPFHRNTYPGELEEGSQSDVNESGGSSGSHGVLKKNYYLQPLDVPVEEVVPPTTSEPTVEHDIKDVKLIPSHQSPMSQMPQPIAPPLPQTPSTSHHLFMPPGNMGGPPGPGMMVGAGPHPHAMGGPGGMMHMPQGPMMGGAMSPEFTAPVLGDGVVSPGRGRVAMRGRGKGGRGGGRKNNRATPPVSNVPARNPAYNTPQMPGVVGMELTGQPRPQQMPGGANFATVVSSGQPQPQPPASWQSPTASIMNTMAGPNPAVSMQPTVTGQGYLQAGGGMPPRQQQPYSAAQMPGDRTNTKRLLNNYIRDRQGTSNFVTPIQGIPTNDPGQSTNLELAQMQGMSTGQAPGPEAMRAVMENQRSMIIQESLSRVPRKPPGHQGSVGGVPTGTGGAVGAGGNPMQHYPMDQIPRGAPQYRPQLQEMPAQFGNQVPGPAFRMQGQQQRIIQQGNFVINSGQQPGNPRMMNPQQAAQMARAHHMLQQQQQQQQPQSAVSLQQQQQLQVQQQQQQMQVQQQQQQQSQMFAAPPTYQQQMQRATGQYNPAGQPNMGNQQINFYQQN